MGLSGTSSQSNSPSAGAVLAALAASTAMFFLGTGLHPWWWVTWFAPLPVLLVASRLRARAAFVVAALAWSIGGLNMWHYMARVLEMPVGLVLVFLIVPGCLFGLVVLLFRMFVRRGAPWKAALAFPCAWVSLEYLNSITSLHGTFPNLGYTQMNCLPVLQIVSVVGIWGISFCLFLVPATIAILLSRQGKSATRKRLAAVTGAIVTGVFLYGTLRLAMTPATGHSVNVCLLATDAGGRFPDIFPQHDKAALELFRRYADYAERLRADVFVLPEKIALLSDEGTAQLDRIFAAAAGRLNALIIVGVDRGKKSSRSNEARVYVPTEPQEASPVSTPGVSHPTSLSPSFAGRGQGEGGNSRTGNVTSVRSGKLAAFYVKHHLLPTFEDVDRPGTELTLLLQPTGIWGIEICKDMDFPALSRQYGAKGVGLLLVPAWDFGRDGWLHGRMAIMRGVESGFTIARVAKTGQLTISDDRGRVLGEESSASAPFSSLVIRAPVRHDDTLYLRAGDYFAWANVAGLLILLLSAKPKSRANTLQAD